LRVKTLRGIALWGLVRILIIWPKVRIDRPRVDPFKVVRTGPGTEAEGDPMEHLQRDLGLYRYVKLPEVPTFTGTCLHHVPAALLTD